MRELDFALTEVYGADEAFCTGTYPSQMHVVKIDGRIIGDGSRGAITQKLQELYMELVKADVERSRGDIVADVEVVRDLTFLDKI